MGWIRLHRLGTPQGPSHDRPLIAGGFVGGALFIFVSLAQAQGPVAALRSPGFPGNRTSFGRTRRRTRSELVMVRICTECLSRVTNYAKASDAWEVLPVSKKPLATLARRILSVSGRTKRNMAPAASPLLTERFRAGLIYAAELHQHQKRKGGEIPSIGHLLIVARHRYRVGWRRGSGDRRGP